MNVVNVVCLMRLVQCIVYFCIYYLTSVFLLHFVANKDIVSIKRRTPYRCSSWFCRYSPFGAKCGCARVTHFDHILITVYLQ